MINSEVKNKIINGDSLKELKKIPDESFDLIYLRLNILCMGWKLFL